jgi:hypothetical protein
LSTLLLLVAGAAVHGLVVAVALVAIVLLFLENPLVAALPLNHRCCLQLALPTPLLLALVA